MELKLGYFATFFVIFGIYVSDATVCFRKHIARKGGCRGLMRKHKGTAKQCCENGAGFYSRQIKLDKKLYSCTPCSELDATISNDVPASPTNTSLSVRTNFNSVNRLDFGEDGWTLWSDWSKCTVTCMIGNQERTRKCKHTNCIGSPTETRICSDKAYCPVNGQWGPWYPWEGCNQSCNGGKQKRRRVCNSPPPMHGGKNCDGNATKIRECNTHPCPVNGHWSSWSEFTECSVTCNTGIRARTRLCNNPAPAYGGKYCKGRPIQHKKCKMGMCPIHGGWSLWNPWSPLSVTCGTGTQFRRRYCNSPPPKYGGRPCEGSEISSRQANHTRMCPINGGWSAWTDYGPCKAAPCQRGFQIKSRTCTSPRPQNGGLYCQGKPMDKQSCVNHVLCTEVDGGWCEWSSWSPCSIKCGTPRDDSHRTRTRVCECPAPREGGRNCSGTRLETLACNNIPPCPSENLDIFPTINAPINIVKKTDSEISGDGVPRGSGCGSGAGADGSDASCDQEPDEVEPVE